MNKTEIQAGVHPGDGGHVFAKVVTPDVDVTVYKHYPDTDDEKPYLVIDVDSNNESDDGATPMRIYRNDAQVYTEV